MANGSKSRGSRSDAAAGSNDDERETERIIDGAGGREADRAGSTVGESSDGSELESGNGGSSSAGGGNESGDRDENGGDRERGSDESSRTRAGTSRRRRSRSRSSGRASNASNEETRSTDDVVSRSVETPKQPRIEIDSDEIPSTSAEIISDSFQFVFWGIGQATGLDEWDLDDDDARDIGRNGDKWLKSLGVKRARNIVKGLNKIGPSLAFFGSIGMALVPRVKVTVKHAKNGTIRPLQTRKASGGGTSSGQPIASGGAPVASGDADNDTAGVRAVPFRPEDFGEVTQGHVSTDDGYAVS